MLKTYADTVAFLFAQLPEYQRTGAAAYKPGLGNTLQLCEAIGNPQHRFKSIHIAGTNGKGSTSHSLASIFQEAGYKTGLYTSPHLLDFRERIRINGLKISEEEVVTKTNLWLPIIETIKPSFFELTVALAFQYFAEQNIDLAVIEVGMGGRLDSTNIIDPELAVITNISYDHQNFLGSTLPLIASEKAGIIKPGKTVVVSEDQEETHSVFEEKAKLENSDLVFASSQYTIRDLGIQAGFRAVSATRSFGDTLHVKLSLLGNYQLKNLPGILESVVQMQKLGWKVDREDIENGLAKVQKNTGLMGRWQILQNEPLIICDTGHNEAGIVEVINQLLSYPHRNLWLIWGMVSDKDPSKIISHLPEEAKIIATQATISRALPKEELANEFKRFGYDPILKSSVAESIEYVLQKADKKDLIFIGGSTFTVAEIPFEKFQTLD